MQKRIGEWSLDHARLEAQAITMVDGHDYAKIVEAVEEIRAKQPQFNWTISADPEYPERYEVVVTKKVE